MKFIQMLFCVFIGTGFLWAEQGTETVTLQLKWKHQFQFAGYYAAQQLGYYQAEGFDVKFREITPGRSVFDEVIDGTATFGIADASIVLQRLNGRPVVILTTVFQHSPLVFLTRSEDDILSPYELRGKRVMFQRNDNDASLIAMLTTLGITEDQYTWVPSSYNSRALLDDNIDAMSGYRTNEPFIYDKLDQPVRLLDPINYGIDFYGDLLFARQDYVEQFPQRAKAFAEASLKGWQYTVEHPQQVVDWI
ncbi:MAG: ABC transporter substrate-binding protein, partial [Reinekea sp.]|nr:ABC transporter substrate-binding protein [Reinekea sp.]